MIARSPVFVLWIHRHERDPVISVRTFDATLEVLARLLSLALMRDRGHADQDAHVYLEPSGRTVFPACAARPRNEGSKFLATGREQENDSATMSPNQTFKAPSRRDK